MANVKTKTKVRKSVKKKFYEVKAPLTATKIHLYGSSPEELEGKVVALDLTRSLRGRSFILKFKVKLSGDELEGEPISLELAGSFIRRSMRSGTDYVEDSFEAECRDAFVRVKPLFITRRRVSRTVLKTLRETARKHLDKYIMTRDSRELFSEIMASKLQKNLASKLRKIYPLAFCEIRVFKIVRAKDTKKSEKSEK